MTVGCTYQSDSGSNYHHYNLSLAMKSELKAEGSYWTLLKMLWSCHCVAPGLFHASIPIIITGYLIKSSAFVSTFDMLLFPLQPFHARNFIIYFSWSVHAFEDFFLLTDLSAGARLSNARFRHKVFGYKVLAPTQGSSMSLFTARRIPRQSDFPVLLYKVLWYNVLQYNVL